MQKKEERMDIAEVLARRRPQRIAKRAMDIVLSAAALVVASGGTELERVYQDTGDRVTVSWRIG